MFKNIFFKFKREEGGYAFRDFINKLSRIYKDAPVDFGGGCSYQKALTLAFFIKEFNLKSSVDIGVYRGRSLFPQSLAHKEFTGGLAYAIDPYESDAAIQKDRPEIQDQLNAFVENTDFNQIYEDVKNIIQKFKLEDQTKFLRSKSHDAVEYFNEKNLSLDLIHIDGNHDTHFVMQDVNDYFPLCSENGVIVLDDISWDSVKPAYHHLKEKMVYVGELIDKNNDFAVFINNRSEEQRILSEKLFNAILKF